jgi:hypothetical protein
MGAVSQAGIALGLALVARRSFPEWGVSLGALIVTMIGVHEAVGPVLFKRALAAVGELREGEGDGQPTVGDSGVMHGAPL